MIERDDVDLVDICTPGDTHAEIAIAALEAGKHVLCEKPLANTVAEAEAMAAAAAGGAARGVRSMVGFTYRRVPAVALARQLVADGRLGDIRHVRAQYLQDWIVDPQFPLVWRLQKEKAGSGALGDIGAHIVDLAQFVTGQTLTGVSALTETFVKERPLLRRRPAALAAAGVGERAPARSRSTTPRCSSARFTGGALAVVRGHPVRHRAQERHPDRGQRLDGQPRLRLRGHERAAVLRRHRAPAATAGFRRILSPSPSTPTSPPGGRPGTASATSTASPTRSSTW